MKKGILSRCPYTLKNSYDMSASLCSRDPDTDPVTVRISGGGEYSLLRTALAAGGLVLAVCFLVKTVNAVTRARIRRAERKKYRAELKAAKRRFIRSKG